MARVVKQHYKHGQYVDHNAGRLCSWCRKPLPPFPYGGMGPPRSYCNAACCKKHSRANGKRRRKAIERGAAHAETINVIEVFEAHGWHCANCGCDTPRALMGKNQWTSPELDHIVPITRGGWHVRTNVQLLCRRCNWEKSKGEQPESNARKAPHPRGQISTALSAATGGGLFCAQPQIRDPGVKTRPAGGV